MIRNTPRSKDAPSWEVIHNGQSSTAGFPMDFQDLCSHAMDQALGVEQASLSAAVEINEYLFDIYQKSFWITPAFADLLDAAAKTFAFYTNLQMSWFALMVPQAKLASEALSRFAEPGGAMMGGLRGSAHSKAAGAESSEDIALGHGNAA